MFFEVLSPIHHSPITTDLLTYRVLLGVLAAVIFLPLIVAFASAWKANGDMQRLTARHRALEIETANYRAALERLTGQIGSNQTTSPDDRATPAPSPQSAPLDSLASTSAVRSSSGPFTIAVPLREANPAPAVVEASAIEAAPAPATSQALESSSPVAVSPSRSTRPQRR